MSISHYCSELDSSKRQIFDYLCQLPIRPMLYKSPCGNNSKIHTYRVVFALGIQYYINKISLSSCVWKSVVSFILLMDCIYFLFILFLFSCEWRLALMERNHIGNSYEEHSQSLELLSGQILLPNHEET